MKSVFNKEVPPSCSYCRFGHVLPYSKQVVCPKKGIRELSDACRAYRYDPLKRKPAKIVLPNDYNQNDFLL